MRTSNNPAAPAEFEDALDAALNGEIRSDTGLTDAVQAALLDVAMAAPYTPPALIQAARDAYTQSMLR